MQDLGNKISDFYFLELLGEGQFGKVFKMKSRINNQIYAVKRVEYPKNMEDLIKSLREKFIMKSLSHPNIVHLYKTFNDNTYLYFVSEFIDGKNLDSLIKDFHKQHPNSYINQDFIINIFKQILTGLIYLHQNNVLHRDIKPDNILIDKNNNIKITDFGISAMYGKEYGFLSYGFSTVGRPDYVCPEILNNQPYDFRCDIFSLGYTIYYIMNFELPTKVKVINKEIIRTPCLKVNNYYSPKLIDLVNRMFRYNPFERPNNPQIVYNELVNIEKEINSPKINEINLNNKNNYNDNQNDTLISSIKCILQCFYGLDNVKFAKNIIMQKIKSLSKQVNNNYFPILFCNILDLVEKKNKKKINDNLYKQSIIEFANELNKKKCEAKGFRPLIIYYNILDIFKKEFNSYIGWTNFLQSISYIPPIDLPEINFPKIYQRVKEFKSEYRNPLADFFYFIILYIERCKNCNRILEAYASISNSLSLLNNENDNSINNLINKYFNKSISNYWFNCMCGYSGNAFEEKALFNSPNYLVMEFEKERTVNFNDEIILNQYIKTNLLHNKYELYAVINKENTGFNNYHFITSIKEKDSWYFYSDNSREKCGKEALTVGIPSLAIYQKK